MSKKKYIINNREFRNIEEFVRAGRGCATPRPNHYQIERSDRLIVSQRISPAKVENIRINIQFIHITDGTKGHINEEQRLKQVTVLNTAFGNTGIEFGYNPDTVKVFNEKTWYKMDLDSPEEREAKTYLHVTPERNLNFYTAGLKPSLLGWATFPYQLDGDRIMDGVVILDECLPGGKATDFNLGVTAVHEIGHWLGLYHTFQGGCDGYGDHVEDTVAHEGPNFGKPKEGLRHNACSTGEYAPIHNYMNYCDDSLLTEFTPKQIDRIKMHVATYRKDLII